MYVLNRSDKLKRNCFLNRICWFRELGLV